MDSTKIDDDLLKQSEKGEISAIIEDEKGNVTLFGASGESGEFIDLDIYEFDSLGSGEDFTSLKERLFINFYLIL